MAVHYFTDPWISKPQQCTSVAKSNVTNMKGSIGSFASVAKSDAVMFSRRALPSRVY